MPDRFVAAQRVQLFPLIDEQKEPIGARLLFQGTIHHGAELNLSTAEGGELLDRPHPVDSRKLGFEQRDETRPRGSETGAPVES